MMDDLPVYAEIVFVDGRRLAISEPEYFNLCEALLIAVRTHAHSDNKRTFRTLHNRLALPSQAVDHLH